MWPFSIGSVLCEKKPPQVTISLPYAIPCLLVFIDKNMMFWEGDNSVLQSRGYLFQCPQNQSSKPIWYTNSRSFNMRFCLCSFSVGRFDGGCWVFFWFTFRCFFSSLSPGHQDYSGCFLKQTWKTLECLSTLKLETSLKSEVIVTENKVKPDDDAISAKNNLQKLGTSKTKTPNFLWRKRHHAFNQGEKSERGFYSVRNPAWLGIIEVAWLQPLASEG